MLDLFTHGHQCLFFLYYPVLSYAILQFGLHITILEFFSLLQFLSFTLATGFLGVNFIFVAQLFPFLFPGNNVSQKPKQSTQKKQVQKQLKFPAPPVLPKFVPDTVYSMEGNKNQSHRGRIGHSESTTTYLLFLSVIYTVEFHSVLSTWVWL